MVASFVSNKCIGSHDAGKVVMKKYSQASRKLQHKVPIQVVNADTCRRLSNDQYVYKLCDSVWQIKSQKWYQELIGLSLLVPEFLELFGIPHNVVSHIKLWLRVSWLRTIMLNKVMACSKMSKIQKQIDCESVMNMQVEKCSRGTGRQLLERHLEPSTCSWLVRLWIFTPFAPC